MNDDFTKSFYFLDGKLANGIMAAYKNEKVIENFLSILRHRKLISMCNRWHWSRC